MDAKDIENKVEQLWAGKNGRRNIVFTVVAVIAICSIVYHMFVEHAV